MIRHAQHSARQPQAPQHPLLAPCECGLYARLGKACIVCRRWQRVYRELLARRAAWGAAA
jgi:hypothetical protein